MHAEIIAVGTELTTGAKLDTNSQWLSRELGAVGIPVHFHTTVGDSLAENVAVFRIAVERADVVLVTGGLGPTLDDLTRQALAELMGVPLVLHEPSLHIIREMFARRDRPMPERNISQAMFPEGSEAISNPRGTAPGIWVEFPRGTARPPARVAAMPGVPSEMKWMFRNSVLPRLLAGGVTGRVVRQARLNCFGLGESQAEELLGDLTARGRDPEVGITVHEGTITLRIEAHGATVSECEAKIAVAKQTAYERLGTALFGEEDEELQDAVVRLLNARGATVSTAEVATGGLMAYRLTEAAGFESCYLGGFVAPSDAAAGQVLALADSEDDKTPQRRSERARAMAAACRERFQTDFGLAVTGFSREATNALAEPVPQAWVALVGAEEATVRELNLAGDPGIAKSRLAKSALDLLRLHLLERI